MYTYCKYRNAYREDEKIAGMYGDVSISTNVIFVLNSRCLCLLTVEVT